MSKYNKAELENLIINKDLSYETVGRMYGVTGAAIKKAAKHLGVKLPKRRKINKCEDFYKKNCKRSKIDNFSDDEFVKIIQSNAGWKNIGVAFGYTNLLSSNIKHRIIERCLTLDLEPKIQRIPPVLLKTKKELLCERKNYQSYRSAIRRLAEKIYRESERNLQCAVCGYDKHVEIAHIKAVSDFDDFSTIAEINSIDNLIALCPNHHWEYDNGFFNL